MTQNTIEVGVVVARRKLKGPWADHAWLPYAVLPAVPALAPGTALGGDAAEETFYAGACALTLHPGETAHYRDNLTSGRPSLWVALRPVASDTVEIALVTADPYEGEARAEGIGETVEPVPMPQEIQAQVALFFERFHVERPFIKRKRDRAPSGGDRRPGSREDGT